MLGRMRRHLTIEALNHVDPIVDTDAHNSHWQGLSDHVIIRVDAMLGAIFASTRLEIFNSTRSLIVP